jgi:hypothetical protein
LIQLENLTWQNPIKWYKEYRRRCFDLKQAIEESNDFWMAYYRKTCPLGYRPESPTIVEIIEKYMKENPQTSSIIDLSILSPCAPL